MSREFQEHLFESFTREETSTVSGIQGTGLGMAINVSHMVQEIAMELLSNAGFSVSLADDGDVAVETLRTAAPDQFDLVLMDIQMPKLDGYSATRRSARWTAPLPKCLADSPFLSANREFSLTRKRGEKVHGSGRFFLAFFRGSVLE